MARTRERDRLARPLPRPFREARCRTIGALAAAGALLCGTPWARAQTAFGEIEGRPAPVSHRRCVGGANAGALCNADAGCPGSTCQQKNIFNVTVAVRFNATAAQLTTIRQQFDLGSQLLLDVTDGQAQLGQVTILNNASMATRGHFWIPSTGGCVTNTGSWGAVSAGNTSIGFDTLSGPSGPSCVAHEFVHQAFDARDEYEARAVGCGMLTGAAQCPDSTQGANSAGQGACLMECCARVGTELCWGQGVADNLAGGNHDATDVTEQSRCRSNRSCWDQIGWSWPNTMLVPAGAPDAGTAGVAHTPVVFVQPAATSRIVLVLDRSGSMLAEAPSRIERLRAAALDVVDMAETGVELGIVSFSTTGSNDVGLAALPAPAGRAAWTTAVNNLAASGATNIGDGLQRGRDMIIGAGGVTAGTGIILMTDGLNNQPPPDPGAHLQTRINTLLADGIPVFVTCTGDDLGLDSQCAEIASGTNGTYVDSADAGDLPDRFVSFFERLRGREPVTLVADDLGKVDPQRPYAVLVEKGTPVVTFVILWRQPNAEGEMLVTDPRGRVYRTSAIRQGRWVRVQNPVPGEWKVTVRPGSGATGPFRLRAYAQNAHAALVLWSRRPVVQPGEPLQFCARPLYDGPLAGVPIAGTLHTPDGSEHALKLLDNGQATNGDEAPDDGTYCALFTQTAQRGAYTLEAQAVAKDAKPVENRQPGIVARPAKPVDFNRSAHTSATVDDREGGRDHYKLYRIRPRLPFAPREVKLEDRFGPSVARVRGPSTLGTPADKNGEGLRDKGTHLECYAIEDRPARPAPSSVESVSQFGRDKLALGRAIQLCLPTRKNQEPADLKADHFKCYEARPADPFRPVPATVGDQFEKVRGRVGDPFQVCVPVRKNGEPPPRGKEDLVCHRWQQGTSAASGKTVSTQNQFGNGRELIGVPDALCVPARVDAKQDR